MSIPDEAMLPATIGALASAIAKDMTDENLALLSIALTQLGDSLGVISALRSKCATGDDSSVKNKI